MLKVLLRGEEGAEATSEGAEAVRSRYYDTQAYHECSLSSWKFPIFLKHSKLRLPERKAPVGRAGGRSGTVRDGALEIGV